MKLYVVTKNYIYSFDPYEMSGHDTHTFVGAGTTFEEASKVATQYINQAHEEHYYGSQDGSNEQYWITPGGYTLDEPFVFFHKDNGDYDYEHAEIVITCIDIQ